jgi:DNA topoisomerase VI subunit B
MSPTAPRLAREVFSTSRLAEFCSRKELVAQTGHDVDDWPLVIVKELLDNALDIAEEHGVDPVVSIEVSTERGEIVIADNGAGIPPETVGNIIDYRVKTSSRTGYVSPTRGQQGNALQTIIAMPFALDSEIGETVVIEAHGVAHHIRFAIDPIRQEPRISCDRGTSTVRNGPA